MYLLMETFKSFASSNDLKRSPFTILSYVYILMAIILTQTEENHF